MFKYQWILVLSLAVSGPLMAAYGSGSEKMDDQGGRMAAGSASEKAAGSGSERVAESGSEKEAPIGLAVGEEAPALTAVGEDGESWTLSQVLETGPALLVFQRGHWCSYCMGELKGIQAKVLAKATEAGISVFALSVDPPATNKSTRKKHGLSFAILSVDEKALEDFGILNHEARTKPRYAHPAVYLVDKGGVIRWARAEKNYKVRAKPEDLIDAFESVLEK